MLLYLNKDMQVLATHQQTITLVSFSLEKFEVSLRKSEIPPVVSHSHPAAVGMLAILQIAVTQLFLSQGHVEVITTHGVPNENLTILLSITAKEE